jgi:signal transduction histidine kinase/integral membrane sensor domain MASE1
MSPHRAEFGPGLRTAGTALAVCAGYYIGANLGFILRFPPTTPSVMWPPNAILTATLLLAPPRRWWIYLLAALPAHLAAELGAFPTPLVLSFFVTNCSEALIGAATVRALNDAPTRFDTLARVTVFIVGAVFLSPFLTSFPDAGVVNLVLGEPFWEVWRTRLLSNMLTELTVAPALVLAISVGRTSLFEASFWRRVEAAVLGFVLLGVGIGAFIGPKKYPAIPGAPVTPLAFLIPFILLAAVRFGPGGATVGFLATTLVAVFAATHDRGPFAGLPLAESVVALQIFMIIVAIPLLCLAALIDERHRTQGALAERLRFEELLSRLSRAFVHLPVHAMDAAFEHWVRHLGKFLHVDRVVVRRLEPDGQLPVAYLWMAPGIEMADGFPTRNTEMPWLARRLLRDEVVVAPRISDLPREAELDAAIFRRFGVRSALMIPLAAGNAVLGTLAFVTLTAERDWPEEAVQRLRLVGEVFASALARRDAEDAGRASEVIKSAILASLSNGVAVMDASGCVIAVNDAWSRFARENITWNTGVGIGDNYLDTCRHAASGGSRHALEAMVGIEAVLNQSIPGFAFEYDVGPPDAERWFAMSVVRLNRPEGGVVVSKTDATERKRAELDAQRSRQELAHFTRVSTMGELTASLAHELNQPLTGILTNAQAARRFLQMRPPDLGELDGALTDIIEDDRRAGEVIQRLRDLLRKGEFQRLSLDLNALIEDIVKLLSSDAIIRNARMTLDLYPGLPPVTGDRVQLQQVVLNLLVNAMEAMDDGKRTEQRLTVRTALADSRLVIVSVEDGGPGLGTDAEEQVFDPFYTTKREGMGMGLPIARSIINAHGGAIWAMNNPTGGATFHFTLPRAAPPA